MMGAGGDDNDQLSRGDDDPLFRMQFHDPRASALTTAATGVTTLTKPAPGDKRLRLARDLSVTSTTSTNTTKTASSAASALHHKNAPPTIMKSPLLHQSCRLFPKCAPVIESAVEMEPDALLIRAEAARKGNNSCFIVGDTRVPYSLPINILLHQDATVDTIRLVAKAAPDALLMKDGRDECCALIIALRLHGRSSRKTEGKEEEVLTNIPAPPTIPEEVLNANTAAAQHHDRRRNFPLHVAAYVGSAFDVINNLYYAYPEALLEKNFHGETPLDICIRNGKCSDISTNFLQEKMDHLKSARLRNAALK